MKKKIICKVIRRTDIDEKWVEKKYQHIKVEYESNIMEFQAPNFFSEFTSIVDQEQEGNIVLTGLPNKICNPNNDSGEDIVVLLKDEPYIKIIEVKGNGVDKTLSCWSSNNFDSHIHKSLNESFGMSSTKRQQIRNIKARNQKVKENDNVTNAINNLVSSIKKNILPIDMTESHIYTNSPLSVGNIHETHVNRSIELTKGVHDVCIFNTNNIKDTFEVEVTWNE